VLEPKENKNPNLFTREIYHPAAGREAGGGLEKKSCEKKDGDMGKGGRGEANRRGENADKKREGRTAKNSKKKALN